MLSLHIYKRREYNEDMLEGFIISIPIFYVIGIVSFIRFLSRGKKTEKKNERIETLKEIIPALTDIVKKGKGIGDLERIIRIYQAQIDRLDTSQVTPEAGLAPEEQIEVEAREEVTVSGNDEISYPAPPKPRAESIQIGLLWSRWYSDNSINLLLYVGAFLIVASAAIFVGFQWDAMPGLIKAGAFFLVTVAFLGSGLFFHRIDAIRTAGFTFISIASILLPFNGIAWYNFYLKEQGFEVGGVWLVTSIFCLSVYVLLGTYLKKFQFTYIVSLAVLSIVLSLVNIFQMNREFYVLGGVFTAFILFLGNKGAGNRKEKITLQEPLLVSSHVILPMSLLFGLIFAIDQGVLLSYETSITLLLSAAFYFLSYSFYRGAGFLVASQLILPLSVYIFMRASNFEPWDSLLAAQLVPLFYLFTRNITKHDYPLVKSTTTHLALGLGIVGFGLQVFFNQPFGIGAALALFIAFLHSFLAYLIERKIHFILFALSLFAGSLFFFLAWTEVDFVFAFMAVQILAVLYVIIFYNTEELITERGYVLVLSRVLAPLSGVLGMMYVISEGMPLYGFGLVFGFVALCFYAICYYYVRFYYYFSIGALLLPVVIFAFCRFMEVPLLISFNTIQLLGIGYMLVSYKFSQHLSGERLSLASISNALIPVMALFISIVATSSSEGFFAKEVVFSSLLGVGYYFINYTKTKSHTYFLLMLVSIVFFTVFFTGWMKLETIQILSIVNIVAGAFLAVGYLLKKTLSEESYTATAMGVFVSVLVMVAHIVLLGYDGLFYFALVPTVYSLIGYLLIGGEILFASFVLFQCLSVYLSGYEFFEEARVEWTALIYLVLTAGYFALSFAVRTARAQQLLLGASVTNGGLSHIFAVQNPKIELVVASIEAGMGYLWYIVKNEQWAIGIGAILTLVAMFFSVEAFETRVFQPVIFFSVFASVYFFFLSLRNVPIAKMLREISLSGTFMSVVFFFVMSLYVESLEMTALLCSYFLTTLFALDAWIVREKNFGYLASILGMGTYFWQVYILGQTEYQVYLAPLGVYLMVLGYFTRKSENKDLYQGLTYGGLGILLGPLLLQTFGENGFYYSLLLGAEGIALIIYGITSQQKLFWYVGIASIAGSVFSQTYNVLFSLPRWVSTAVAGLSFIAVAIFLLLRRKDLK